MSDPTTRLREALAEVIERSDGEPYTEVDDVYLLNADAILACLPEHRDDVLAVLGMEQVGWIDYPAPAGNLYDEDEGGFVGVYAAFRPKEQPADG